MQAALDDPAWWSFLARCPGRVASIDRAVDAGAAGATSTIERVRLRFVDPGIPDAHLVVKRGRGGFAGLGLQEAPPQWRVEAAFYRERAERLPVRIAGCWHAEADESGTDGLLVLEDLMPERPWLEPIDAVDVDEAIDAIAAMHAATWGEPLPWAPTGGLLIATSMPAAWERLRPSVPAERRDAYDALVPLLPALAASTARLPHCLVHGDLSPRNLLRAHDGQLALIDFGTACASSGGIDVSRLVSSCAALAGSLDAHRAAARRWHRALESRGVRGFGSDDAWSSYLLGMALNAQYGPMQEAVPWADGARAQSYRLGATLMHAALTACSVPDFARAWLR